MQDRPASGAFPTKWDGSGDTSRSQLWLRDAQARPLGFPVPGGDELKNDLVINAYKPKEEFKNRFLTLAGEGMEIDFVKQQLEHFTFRTKYRKN